MLSSPYTPKHSRHASKVDLSYATPQSGNTSPRRLSKSSLHTPTTPLQQTFGRSQSIGVDVFANGGQEASNELGNLADELANAWDDEEAEDDGDEAEEELDMNFHKGEAETEMSAIRDSGIDVAESPLHAGQQHRSLKLPPDGMRHRRKRSDYDGSDYGEDSDMEISDLPASLVARMDLIESLARRGTESNETDGDGPVARVVAELKDLGGQSGVESVASRLITAHTSLSSHLVHQTRVLHSLAYSLFSPLSLPPSEETIDDLLSLLSVIPESIPRPTTAAFTHLTQLHSSTTDLVQTLNYLSDTLHMTRQTTTTATRRLKSAREVVADLRKEEELREEGESWVRRGNWCERLANRECAGVCGKVVDGFEEVCNDWRARLVAQAEAVGA